MFQLKYESYLSCINGDLKNQSVFLKWNVQVNPHLSKVFYSVKSVCLLTFPCFLKFNFTCEQYIPANCCYSRSSLQDVLQWRIGRSKKSHSCMRNKTASIRRHYIGYLQASKPSLRLKNRPCQFFANFRQCNLRSQHETIWLFEGCILASWSCSRCNLHDCPQWHIERSKTRHSYTGNGTASIGLRYIHHL